MNCIVWSTGRQISDLLPESRILVLSDNEIVQLSGLFGIVDSPSP